MNKQKLEKLRKVVQLHTNWLAARLFGTDTLSGDELKELQEYGKLPIREEVGLVDKSYVLGRLRSVLKSSEYKDINYNELEQYLRTTNFTSLEELAVEEARLHAATSVKKLTDDIAAGAFERLSQELQETVTTSTVQGIIRDQAALALQEKKGYEKFASSLAKELKTDWRKDWRRLAETELQRAKIRGTVMAIVNKVDIYQHSDGIDSLVSIVPSSDCCEDCSYHYLDNSGNPKIFKLRQLLQKGSNSDSNVSHERKKGRHVNWKTTLSPLHPRCGCSLVYVPPGMSWVNKELKVTDKEVYVESLSKAVDKTSTSPTIKPPGPESSRDDTPSATAATSPGSIPGAAAPSNSPGPGRPSSGGQNIEWEYYKEPGSPPGDQGWEKSPSGAWRRPMGSGGKAGSPEQEEAKQQLKIQEAKEWSKQPHSDQTIINHLGTGEIAHQHELGEEGGINESHRVTIDGNGRGIMKPSPELPDFVKSGKGFIDGCGTVPHGTQHKREQAAYKLFSALGMDHCPPTTQRVHDGKEHSVQHWTEGKSQAAAHLASTGSGQASASRLIDEASDSEKVKEKLSEVVTMDIIMNSNDRHMGNLVVDENNYSNINAIDHGSSFGSGMMGYKNIIHKQLHSSGHKVKMPEHMQERLKNTTLGDMKRSLGDHVEDWSVGQTFLRSQYALHLQETDGHLDYRKFQGSVFTTKEEAGPSDKLWTESTSTWMDKSDRRELSHQRFEDFCIDFLDNASADSSHPHHEAAKELKEKGVFMGPGAAENPQEYRNNDKHQEYEKKIRTRKQAADNLKKLQGEGSKDDSTYEEFREPGKYTDDPAYASTQRAQYHDAAKEKEEETKTPAAKKVEQKKREQSDVGTNVEKGLFISDPNRLLT